MSCASASWSLSAAAFRDAVCVFYLVLRALDTVEDDMTLALETKTKLLMTFHEKLECQGWRFLECGPLEKDRSVLVDFDQVLLCVLCVQESDMILCGCRTTRI